MKLKLANLAPELIGVHNLSSQNLLHANEVGGLVAPSLAITKRTQDFSNFGEITLIAPMSMIDPRKTPVFDADIYSARYPQVGYKGDAKKIKQLQETHKEYLARTNAYMGDLDYEIQRRGLEAFFGARKITAFSLAFLEQVKGKKLDAPIRSKPREYEWVDTPIIKQFFAANGLKHNARTPANEQPETPDEIYYVELSQAVREGITEFYNSKAELDAIDKQDVIGTYVEQLFNPDTGWLYFSKFDKILRESQSINQSEPDYFDFERQLREEIAPYEDEFREWVLARIQGAEGQRYLTSEGGRKMPYNPDNVLKLMTKKLKGAENFNYGLGSVRAVGATRFKSFDDMNATAHRIVPHEVFQGIKEEQNTKFFQLVNELSAYHPVGNNSFRSSDALQSALAESFKPGRSLARELQKDGYQGLPPELVSKVNQFRSELKRAPTEYFEAKPQRIIRLDEFVGAVVPDDTAPAVLAALRENKLPIATYSKDGSRQAAIAQLAGQVLSATRTAGKLALGKVAAANNDLQDAVDWANDTYESDVDVSELALVDSGEMDPRQLPVIDASHLPTESGDDGSGYFDREDEAHIKAQFDAQKVNPVIIISGPEFEMLADGYGRAAYAIRHNYKVPYERYEVRTQKKAKLNLGKVAQTSPEIVEGAEAPLAKPNWIWDSPPEILEQFPLLKTLKPQPEYSHPEQYGKKFWIWRTPRGFGITYPGANSGSGVILAEANFTNSTLKLSRQNPLAHPDTADLMLLLANEPDYANLKVIGDEIDGTQTIRELAALVQEQKHEAPLYGREVEGEQYATYRYRVIKDLAKHEWYHVTRASLLPSIMKRGLLPSAEARQEGVEGWSPPTNMGLQNAVYLTALQEYAERIAETLAGRFMEDIVILKISCPLDPRTLTVDEDALRNDFDASIGSYDTRYPAFIESVSDSIQSVGVKAAIPPNCIEEIARLSAPIYVKDEFKNDSYYLDGGLEWSYPDSTEDAAVAENASVVEKKATRLSLG